MGFFDRFKKQPEPVSEYKTLSALGDNQSAWAGLDAEQLKEVIMVKCIEYGTTQDGSSIPRLFALYRYALERLTVPERLRLLADFSALTEEQGGLGHMGLMMFMAGDYAPAVVSSAALSLCVLYKTDGIDPLAGPRFVVSILAQRESDPVSLGAGLGGVLLLGDKRITPLLAAAWDRMSEAAKLEMTKAKSGLVAEAIVEFWLDRLEEGCSKSVFGSAVAAIAKMPAIAQAPFVVDIKRTLPAYSGAEPITLLRKTSLPDYLSKIRPRLDALLEIESEPKVIPEIYKIWNNPDAYRGIIG